ncbi:CAP domain-containing protein [Palleronia rufa]
MTHASPVELLMLDLVNEERTSRGLNPLRINDDLSQSAEDHSEWMLDTDRFGHTGAGGSSATDRIREAGYALDGNWETAENIAWQSERGRPGISDDVAQIHESFMNSPRHRSNILDPDLEEIGIGVERGDFTTTTGTFDGVMITQNFGRTDAEEEMLVASLETANAVARNLDDAALRQPVGGPLDLSETQALDMSDTFVFV